MKRGSKPRGLKDTQGRYVTVNDAWLKRVGLTRELAIGRNA